MSQSQLRQFQMVGGAGSNPGQYNDTTFTKIFVGGLAWETQRDTMRRYFEQFGEILEAVVISDKNTGRSKGYGFVTFKDPEAAMRACQNPSPVIDGRRANCNLASLGAQKPPRPPTPHQHGVGRLRSTVGLMASAPPYHGSSSSSSSSSIHHPPSQYTFRYSAYGYTGYSPDTMYPLNYYGVYGGQQFSPYYNTGASGTTGMFQNFYPFYTIYPQSGQQAHGFGVQYPPMAEYPYMPLVYNSSGGILSLPSQLAIQSTTTEEVEIYNTTGATTMTTTTTATMATTIAQPQRSPLLSIPSSSISTTGVVGARSGALQASGSASESNLSTK